MSSRIRTSLFAAPLAATALLTGTLAPTLSLAPAAHAQAVSAPGTDQPQTSASAIQKAQNSKANQPNMSLPNNALKTNPHTIAEQPDQAPPASPSSMTGTSATGAVPSAQTSAPRVVPGRRHKPHRKATTQNPAGTPQ